MIVFVNGRPVDSRTLNYALIESYAESLPKGRYPLAFVFFACDPAAVDVNVHPAKREVRFRSEPQVRGFVIRAVLQRLRESATGELRSEDLAKPEGGDRKPESAAGAARSAEAGPEVAPGQGGEAHAPARGAVSGSVIRRSDLPALRVPVTVGPAAASPVARPDPQSGIRTPQAPSTAPAPAWRFVGLAHGNYALFETASGVVLLDRRAAHERVWFERLRDQFRAGAGPSQRLLLPVPVELDAIASALLLDRLAFLQRHGFEVAEFGRNFFRVEAVPGWMEPADAEPFLRDLLGAFRDGSIPDRDTDLARDELARLAVAKAVRLPETVAAAEVTALVAQLFATRSPLTSPAGRPTFVELNHAELARRFQK
jgi:DNA mismatch repair protein MutL